MFSATLSVYFNGEPATAEGAVTGRIRDIAIDGTPIAGKPEIALSGGRANGGAHAWVSVWRGTRMTFDGASWDGEWRAAFFGNPTPGGAGADKLPVSIAGAFGVTRSGDEGEAFVGAFGARRRTAFQPSRQGRRSTPATGRRGGWPSRRPPAVPAADSNSHFGGSRLSPSAHAPWIRRRLPAIWALGAADAGKLMESALRP